VDDNAALPLDRLNDHRAGPPVDCRGGGREIAVGDMRKTGHERPESVVDPPWPVAVMAPKVRP